jgi:hypothetical protein
MSMRSNLTATLTEGRRDEDLTPAGRTTRGLQGGTVTIGRALRQRRRLPAVALAAGLLVAGASMLTGSAGAAPQDPLGVEAEKGVSAQQRQAGVPVGAVAPTAVEPAAGLAPNGRAVTPRSHRFRHCGNRRVCIFRGANYRIWKVTFGARYARVWRWILISDGVARRHYSAKNRFHGRRLLLRGSRANGTWRRYCLNPRTNRRGPLGPGMLQFKIGRAGSRC